MNKEMSMVFFELLLFGAITLDAREAPTRAPERLPRSRAEVKEYVEIEKLASLRLTEYQGVYQRAEGDLKNVLKQKTASREFPNPAMLWKGATPVLEVNQPDGRRVKF